MEQSAHANAKVNLGRTGSLLETGAIDAPVKDVHWQAQQAQAESTTHLEDDEGHGGAAIIREFKFGVNPQAFKIHKPTKQELFNSHIKQIEHWLWRDGMKIMTDVEPRVILDKKKKFYSIFVGAVPQRGHILTKNPQLLRDVMTKTV